MFSRARTAVRNRWLHIALAGSLVLGGVALGLSGTTTPVSAEPHNACRGPNNPPPPTTIPTTTVVTLAPTTTTTVPPTTTTTEATVTETGFNAQEETTTTVEPTTTTTAAPPAHFGALVTGALAGGLSHVKIYNALSATEVRGFYAYGPTFNGGVHVALGDVDGDGYQDIVTGAGPGGGPHVKVFSGQTGDEIRSFFAYAPAFKGGVYVAACDMNNDGKAEIITGAGAGGSPHVQVFDGSSVTPTPALLSAAANSFNAYDPGFTGGVRVAAADMDGDGKAEVVTAAGPGGGPHVKAFKSSSVGNTIVSSFFASDAAFTGGVFVGASVDGAEVGRIATSLGTNAAIVSVWLANGQYAGTGNPRPFTSGGSSPGVMVAIGNVDGDAADEVGVGQITGGASKVGVGDLPGSALAFAGDAYPGFPGGASVAMGVI